mgnify:CR=1 FL=1
MWEEFRKEEFEFKGKKATILYPEGEPNGKMLLKTEYLKAFPTFDIAMLKKGYYLIHITHRSRWAPDDDIEIMADFVQYCAEKLSASKRCILEGLSAGGMQAARFAQRYPELAAVLYLDAPALNLLSMAGLGLRKIGVDRIREELLETYNLNESTVVNFRESPIDHMDHLIDNHIPIIMLYGDADDVVIYEENGKVLEEYYKVHGGTLKTIVKKGCGHHPHGLDDPTPIINFIEKIYN